MKNNDMNVFCALVFGLLFSLSSYGHHTGPEELQLSYLESVLVDITFANTVSFLGLVFVCSVLIFKVIKHIAKNY